MKKKIFITGISSPIMLNLINLIQLSEYEIIGLTRKRKLSLNNVTVLHGDLQELNNYDEIIKECDIIIHAAAITHSHNKEEYFEINYKATEYLCKMIDLKKEVKFVFISSNTANKNSGEYAQSKFLAEKAIKKYCSNYLILRPSEIYGSKSKEGIEDIITKVKTKKILFYPNKIPSKFSPIHIRDATNYIFHEIFEKSTNKNQTISINGNELFSFYELYALAEKTFKTKKIKISIPYFLMKFIDISLNTFPLKMGIYPDQIKRLYGIKSIDENLNFNKYNLKNYLLE
ncbi:MAG: NAD(P)-dependent oxidoreductase [Chitinophagales bacterium]